MCAPLVPLRLFCLSVFASLLPQQRRRAYDIAVQQGAKGAAAAQILEGRKGSGKFRIKIPGINDEEVCSIHVQENQHCECASTGQKEYCECAVIRHCECASRGQTGQRVIRGHFPGISGGKVSRVCVVQKCIKRYEESVSFRSV